MRRPFKFFFGLSIAIMLFFFLARVFVAAMFMAIGLSLAFFVLRKIKNFFKYMAWEDERDYSYESPFRKNISHWEREEEPLFEQRERRYAERIIIVE